MSAIVFLEIQKLQKIRSPLEKIDLIIKNIEYSDIENSIIINIKLFKIINNIKY